MKNLIILTFFSFFHLHAFAQMDCDDTTKKVSINYEAVTNDSSVQFTLELCLGANDIDRLFFDGEDHDILAVREMKKSSGYIKSYVWTVMSLKPDKDYHWTLVVHDRIRGNIKRVKVEFKIKARDKEEKKRKK